MKILSIYWSMCSSASISDDNQIIAAAHQERFSRNKNDDQFPIDAIHYCMEEAGVSGADIDLVAITSNHTYMDAIVVGKGSEWTVKDYLFEQYQCWKPNLYEGKPLPALADVMPQIHNRESYPGKDFWDELLALPAQERQDRFDAGLNTMVANVVGVEVGKVVRIEHHRCHAMYAYYSSPFRNEDVLSLTIDGWGDGLNATAGVVGANGEYKRFFETGDCSIGRIYRYLTLVLGMKPNEHEYKVMGLAPYGKAKYAQEALDVFRSTLYVDGLDFKYKIQPKDCYFWFKEKLEGQRFDTIAYALQTWTEELLTQWVRNAIQETGIDTVVLSGGVAMNIKAMGHIADLPEVKKIFIGGSGSDESLCLSAGFCAREDYSHKNNDGWSPLQVKPILSLYLGPQATENEEKQTIANLNRQDYEVYPSPSSLKVAELLQDGLIVARCAGRMEFGQRALGNRSIFADPQKVEAKEKINAAIKNRDFWMPFAPILLDRFSESYLANANKAYSPHMTIGFDTTPEGYASMKAACHPADKSARPQMLTQEANPQVYDILEAFAERTGRGALLNTSFNFHGSPIVNTPAEAVEVLEGSELDALLLNHYLIVKKR
jgi:carbamoyltransferase